MQSRRGWLLIPLFLLVAALCCSWRPADASAAFGQSSNASSILISRPVVRTFSGEPDIGNVKLPPKTTLAPALSRDAVGPGGSMRSLMDWLVWFGRIWMARSLGVG